MDRSGDEARPESRVARAGTRIVETFEDVVHFVIVAVLFVVAVVVLARTAGELLHRHHGFAATVTDAINGVLFVVIVMELLRTVMAHFERGGFQLQPFLVIGIISVVRHILTVGARLTLGGEAPSQFARTQVELAVNAGVVLVLTVGLVLIRRTDADGSRDA